MSKEAALAVAQTVAVETPTPQPTQESAPQAAPETAPQASAQPEMQSKAFSHLAKKEAELRRRQDELKAEREKVTPILKKYEEFESLKKNDPIAAMKMLGFSETDIFNYMAQNAPEELTPEQKAAAAAESAAEAKIKAFEDAQSKKELERQKVADQQVIQAYRGEVSKLLKSKAEDFEYCNFQGAAAEELIYETVLAIAKESNGQDVPTPLEAARMVEEYYEEQDKAMSKLKKRQPANPALPPEPVKPERSRTLANMNKTIPARATATVASVKTTENESRSAKRERLIEKLRNG